MACMIQFHKTKELQLFLPKGLEVYMEYFQGAGAGRRGDGVVFGDCRFVGVDDEAGW